MSQYSPKRFLHYNIPNAYKIESMACFKKQKFPRTDYTVAKLMTSIHNNSPINPHSSTLCQTLLGAGAHKCKKKGSASDKY